VGLEAADKLREHGLAVTVLDRNPWPLARHLDRHAGSLLRRLLVERGIRVIAEATACQLAGSERLRRVICLVAAGIAPNTKLAATAGLTVGRGVIVDVRLRTSDPRVYAVGDVAEYAGQIAGLWQASIEQARLAAVNLLGGEARYQPTPVPLALQVSGIDLLAVGTLTPPEDERRTMEESTSSHSGAIGVRHLNGPYRYGADRTVLGYAL
jgi:NAD(P)H-nitrite reductase large subunit